MPTPQQHEENLEIQGDKTKEVFPIAFMQVISLALDAAATDVEFPAIGNFLFADLNSTGIITVKINNSAMPSFPMQKNSFLKCANIKRLFISNTAQATKIINLWYGRGVDYINTP